MFNLTEADRRHEQLVGVVSAFWLRSSFAMNRNAK